MNNEIKVFTEKVNPTPSKRGHQAHNTNSLNISIRLPLHLVKKLDEVAKSLDISRGSVIRSGLENLFKE